MVFVAAGLGVALALGLYQWESSSRAAVASRRPVAAARESAAPPPPVAAQASGTATAAAAQIATASAATSATASAAPAPEIEAGGRAFARACDLCHPSAKAGVGPAVYGPEFNARYPEDGPLKLVIREGRGAMPATPLTQLSDSDLNAVVAYLRSLK